MNVFFRNTSVKQSLGVESELQCGRFVFSNPHSRLTACIAFNLWTGTHRRAAS